MSKHSTPPESEHDRDAVLLRLASRTARLGGWRAELNSGRVIWDRETAVIHEEPPGTHPSLEDGINYYAPAYRERIRHRYNECVSHGTPFDEELQIITARGNHVWVRTIGEAERDDSGRIIAVQGAFQDISAQVQAQKRSDELSRRLQQTLEGMSDAFLLLDHDWTFRFLNPRAERILGRSAGDLIGKNLWEEFPDTLGTEFQRQYERAMYHDETVRLREYYYPAPLDRWFEVNAYPGPDGLAVYFRDITDRRITEEKLARSERLNAIGELTGGVAHDFNNLLTVILGNAELLVERLEEQPDDLRSLAEMAANAATRGAELTSRLLAFARRQALEPQTVDVNQLLAGMDSLLRRTLGMNIHIEVIRQDGLWVTEIDPGQLEVALLNLTINARDAMPDGGRLTIETANIVLDENIPGTDEDEIPGDYVMITVSDTGTGMEPEIIEKAFEPFFTTKGVGEGSGLGLSMVYGFVRQSRGYARIRSESGQGSTIELYFPRSGNGRSTSSQPADERTQLPGGDEHILVVEDDELVRRHLVSQLQLLGYRVTDTDSGPSAMDILRAKSDIDLLFTDVVMPGNMNGQQLAREATALRPGLAVLYTSGYTENVLVSQGQLAPGVPLLNKPYRYRDVAREVREALDRR
ncbi:MAG: PAS domain-containing protein [Pseudohongiellaceae bacterium]